ncbi:hypothetical protein EV363DRAFT_1584558 [Boletus edulis]|nr:hypothetical protein EV363DRAFT_1584558 [Boletus edulis]
MSDDDDDQLIVPPHGQGPTPPHIRPHSLSLHPIPSIQMDDAETTSTTPATDTMTTTTTRTGKATTCTAASERTTWSDGPLGGLGPGAAVTTMTLETRTVDGREQAVVRETVEVPYNANDLEGRRREELVMMVQRQVERWPYHDGKRRFTSKTNMDRMRAVLLNCTFGFTKEVEVVRPLSPSPPPPPPPPGTPSLPPGPREDVGMEHLQDAAPPLPDNEVEGGPSTRIPEGGRVSPSVQHEDNEDNEDGGQWGTIECAKVNVYVTFLSPGAEVQRNAFSIEVPRTGWVDALACEWQTDTQQLIEQLAVQAPQLADAIEVSYPDPMYPEYSRRLKAVGNGLNIIETPAEVPAVCIVADNVLKLTVSSPSHLITSESLPTGPVHQPAGQSQSVPVATNELAPVSPVVQWLVGAAEMREGYIAFKQGQHHVQTNANIVASWWFAVLFSECYSQAESPVLLAGGSKRKGPRLIRKSEVQRALGVGATWMSEAMQAVALLRKYGRYGSSPRQHVVNMCSDQTSKIGARTLLTRLREEDKE